MSEGRTAAAIAAAAAVGAIATRMISSAARRHEPTPAPQPERRIHSVFERGLLITDDSEAPKGPVALRITT